MLYPIDLLPKELLEQIQKYIDGKTIYIPKKSENRKHWGDNTFVPIYQTLPFAIMSVL